MPGLLTHIEHHLTSFTLINVAYFSFKSLNIYYLTKNNPTVWRQHTRLITHIEHHLTSFNINQHHLTLISII
jgi:hypothetical protein